MQPDDYGTEDAQLKGLLREWTVPGPPRSFEDRVLRSCAPWYRTGWRWLFTGYVRVPVALVYVLAVLMAAAVWKSTIHAPAAPCVADAHGAPASTVHQAAPPVPCDHAAAGVC